MNNTKRSNPFEKILSILIAEKELTFLVLLAVLGTLAPHPANVTPIAALGLFAGTYMQRKIFLLVPVIAVFIADMSTAGFYNIVVMLFVYLGFLASSLSGRFLLRNKRVLTQAPIAVLVASGAFFLISNFGNWLAFYPLSVSSLMDCYISGLPYFARTLVGNALYSLLFFGSFEFFLYANKARYANTVSQ